MSTATRTETMMQHHRSNCPVCKGGKVTLQSLELHNASASTKVQTLWEWRMAAQFGVYL